MREFGIHSYNQSNAPVADLVLVHGLKGNSKSTWAGTDDKGQRTYWPDWIKEQRPNVNIWLADYDSSLDAWLQPAMPLDQIGGSLLMHAKDQGLGTRPIHWVGHSMGGLIIKYLLCHARTKADPSWTRIGEVPTAITFLGTPHHGSEVAKWEQYFTPLLTVLDIASTGGVVTAASRITKFLADRARNAKIESHVQQLRAHAKPLGDLNDAFAQWLGAASRAGNLLRVRNYYETIPVYKAVMVVPQHSAQLSNALVEEGAAPANHFDICKFSSTGNAVFNSIIVSLNDLPGPNAPAGDLLDRAWRKALDQCSAKVRAVVCDEMKKTFDGRSVSSAELEKALGEAFERVAPVKLLADVRYAMGYPRAGFSGLSQDECGQRSVLYVLLLARAVAVWRQSDLRTKAVGGVIVPDADDSKRLAIAVAAHMISGQGLLLKIEPGAVRPDNLLYAAALTDAPAHPPGQPSGPSPLEVEIREWLRRVLNTPHEPLATELLKAYLDRFEDDHDARPILLDSKGSLADPAVKALVDQLRIGVVGVAANDRPANISPEDWHTLCHTFELKAFDLTGQAPVKQTLSEPKPQPTPPLQVNLHQTFSAPVGQSNVTTGSHSPIQAQHAAAAQPDAAHDALALAVFGFETALNDHLRELHTLLLRKDPSPPALSLLRRLLRPLGEAAQASAGAASAWERLRHAAHTHWPDSRTLF
jgi:pimeloyl-ACP methyl ester carboxylesterase